MAHFTFLGTGTSQGVPVIGCKCDVCTSSDARDHRLRTSALVEIDDKCIVIDTGPDFRQQMLRERVKRLDAILFTHHHKDHTGGLDDVRAYNFIDFPTIHPIDIYATATTARYLRKDYDYAFAEKKYLGAPELVLHEFSPEESVCVSGIEVIPIKGTHAPGLEVIGYRIGRMAYLTDFKEIEPAEVAKLQGVEHLIVNALRFEPHHSHFNVEQAISLIREISPKESYLTHISHRMGLYSHIEQQLPENVRLGYDRLKFDF